MKTPDTLTLPRQHSRTAVVLAALGLTLFVALYWILVVRPPATWLAVFIDIALMAGAVVVVTALVSSWAVGYPGHSPPLKSRNYELTTSCTSRAEPSKPTARAA